MGNPAEENDPPPESDFSFIQKPRSCQLPKLHKFAKGWAPPRPPLAFPTSRKSQARGRRSAAVTRLITSPCFSRVRNFRPGSRPAASRNTVPVSASMVME